jgi:hypothetical protein
MQQNCHQTVIFVGGLVVERKRFFAISGDGGIDGFAASTPNLKGANPLGFPPTKRAPQAEPILLAETEGFEPSIRFCRILTFQASAFDHSATSPHCWKRAP